MNTNASCDQIKPIRIGENLVGNYNGWWYSSSSANNFAAFVLNTDNVFFFFVQVVCHLLLRPLIVSPNMVLKPFQMPSDEKWDRGEYWSAWLNLERFRLLEYAKLPSQWNSFGIILTPRWKKIIKTNVLTEVSLQCYCKATHSFPQGVCAGSTRVVNASESLRRLSCLLP